VIFSIGRCSVALGSSLMIFMSASGEAPAGHRPADRHTLEPPLCYELKVGTWKLTNAKGDVLLGPNPKPEAWWQPPAAILLDAAPPAPDEKQGTWVGDSGNAVRPDGVPAPHWVFKLGSWEREAPGIIVITWSGGYTVTVLRFPALQREVSGVLTAQTDVLGLPEPTAEVILRQKTCSSAQRAPNEP